MALPSEVTDKLIQMVKNNVGRPNDSVMDDFTIQWINDTQKEVCNKANFWFMRKDTTLSFAQSDASKALPSDFKDEDGFYILDSTTNTFTKLRPMDYEDYRNKYDDTTEAQPSNYVLDGAGNVLLRPIPDKAYTIILDYWSYLTDLTDPGVTSNDLLDNYPEILEAGATYKAFRRLGERENMALWKGIYDGKLQDLVVSNADRELPDEMVFAIRTDVRGNTLDKIKNRIE